MSERPNDEAPTVVPLGGGRYAVERGSTRRIAFAATHERDVWVFLDGDVFVVPDEREDGSSGTSRATLADAASLAAPMPATVALVHVEVGQSIDTGQVLVVLEAMKMELPITAPHAGRVTAVRCRVGELVSPGVPLVELE